MKSLHASRYPVLLLVIIFVNGCAHVKSGLVPTATPSSFGIIVATPVSSTGCHKSSPAANGASVSQMIYSAGLQRTFLVHIPQNYNDAALTSLVLNFHGYTEDAQQQESYSQESKLGDEQTFIAVYPQGVRGAYNQYAWNTYGPHSPQVNDVLYVSDMLNYLQQELCVDPSRIYATGISNGGGMVNLLACTMSDRIAAFAGIASAIYSIPGGCHPARAVPYLEFHGTGDPIVPYNGKSSAELSPIMQQLQDWAALDNCTQGPSTVLQQADITELQWSICKNSVLVEHYRIDGGGHTWPGSPIKDPLLGKTTETISATEIGWAFFQQFHIPGV